MPYYITKTGLDAFDTARAWGLAVILNVITRDEVQIADAGWGYIVEPASVVRTGVSLSGNTAWAALFQEENWQRVFMTAKEKWSKKRDQAKGIVEQQIGALLANLQKPTNTVTFSSGTHTPLSGLEPAGFKGLRHTTRAGYREDGLKVPPDHWALACLGMATCGRYYPVYRSRESQRRRKPDEYLVLLPVPQDVRFSYFRDVQDLFRLPGLEYHGVQNAAAHYAVQLAERLRRRVAAQGSLQDYFSAVIYFTLAKPTKLQANWKPAQGNQLRLEPLMEAIARDPHKAQPVLEWLDYCFRLGSTKGAEDLALAATELVMRWDLDAYERLVRILVRYWAQDRIKWDNLPETNTVEEVISHVSV